MAKIFYKTLKSLQPIELKYAYTPNENNIKKIKFSLNDGFTFIHTDSLKNFQDITINKESIFILTSAIDLQSSFNTTQNYKYGQLPGSLYLQPNNSTIYFAAFENLTNTITLSTVGTQFYLSPINNTNTVEIIINGSFVQVEEEYPFKVYTSIRSLPTEDINRQRFECIFNADSSTITFKTLTKEGYRYLAFTTDNILRATGVVFNTSVLNDYVFKAVPITRSTIETDTNLTNPWVTYFSSFEQEQESKSLAINKIFTPLTNFLIHLPIEQTVSTGIGLFNAVNLRTGVVATGRPPSINNLSTN